MSAGEGRAALDALDRALAKRPHADHALLAEATRHAAAFRDALARTVGADGDTPARRRLGEVNAVVSLLISTHFPLGEPPWGALERSRPWLAAAVEAT